MKTKNTFLIATVMLFLIIGGCSKNDDTNNQQEIEGPFNEPTNEQIDVVLSNATRVEQEISIFFKDAETIEDMAKHLNEMKAMENVDDAWQDDDITISVKIKDGGVLSWCFFPEIENEDEEGYVKGEQRLKDIKQSPAVNNTRTSDIALCKEKTVCIANALSNEIRVRNNPFGSIKDWFEENDYKVTTIDGENVNLAFFCKDMPNYGVNILLTHGGYSQDHNTSEYKHWLMTGTTYDTDNEELPPFYFYDRDEYRAYFPDGRWSFYREWHINDNVRIWFVKELRDFGDFNVPDMKVETGYLAVSETYLKSKLSCSFPNNSLMFVAACKSLKSNPDLSKVFREKGLGCYFGYDNTVSSTVAFRGMRELFDIMLNKAFIASDAYAKIPNTGKVYEKTGAHLRLYPEGSNICLASNTSLTRCPDDLHPHAIDLGLPSGVKWACCNVGASRPEDNGGYYAWGEIEQERTNIYNMSTYDYYDEETGWVDIGADIAGTEYDVAKKIMGNPWRMPTLDQMKELINNCTSEWSLQNGRVITGPNGGQIFLPAAGYRSGDSRYDMDRYWSSSYSSDFKYNAYAMYFGLYWSVSDYYRHYGFPVRAVCPK